MGGLGCEGLAVWGSGSFRVRTANGALRRLGVGMGGPIEIRLFWFSKDCLGTTGNKVRSILKPTPENDCPFKAR